MPPCALTHVVHLIAIIFVIFIIIVVVAVIVIIITTFSVLIGIPFTAIQGFPNGTVRTVIAEVTAQFGFSFLLSWQSALTSLIAHECLYLVARQYVALVNRPGEIEFVHIDAAGKRNVGLALREHSLIQVDPD